MAKAQLLATLTSGNQQRLKSRALASAAELKTARKRYTTMLHDLVIDEGAKICRVGPPGAWVQAWVWIYDEEVQVQVARDKALYKEAPRYGDPKRPRKKKKGK